LIGDRAPRVRNVQVTGLADLHGRLPWIEPTQLLVLAGDVVPYEVERDMAASHDWLDGPFRRWLEDVHADEVVGIAGNHDLVLADERPLPEGLRWQYLQDSEIRLLGLRIYGTPWTAGSGNWAFQVKPSELARKFDLIPAGLDVLITHSPPYGHGDDVHAHQRHRGRPRLSEADLRGSPELLAAIERAQPQLAVFGHIHESGGYRGRIGRTQVRNVASLTHR
jgi:Icc-related predicted phosphoesterase